MSEKIKVDKDYIEAFNLGYELAKELNLKSAMFKDINSGNKRMEAMQAGMAQYSKETIQKNKGNTLGLGVSSNNENDFNQNLDQNKGFDLST